MTFDPILKGLVCMNVVEDITEQISNILSL
jgi:hypothetical protein